ncbi:MAG: Tad domain-containing protein [Elusimicrobiota bacterium]
MARNTRRGRNDRGQILIPALFVLPSLVLIVILLVETGNLSRAKIRQQFALDAAATVEMELYTDTLNRLAYLNGVFPDRIFREVYGLANTHYGGSGLYPSAVEEWEEKDEVWPIRYAGFRSYANTPNPPLNFGILHTHMPGGGLVTLDHASKMAVDYIQVYRWLGNVATSQKLVFEHTVRDHGMLRKSMYMNLRENEQGSSLSACASGEDSCGNDSASDFLDIDIRMHYLSGFKHCPVIVPVGGTTLVGELAGAFSFTGSGLWQLATVPPSQIAELERGYVVKHHWEPPRNFFRVNFVEEEKQDVYKKDTGNIEDYQASNAGYKVVFKDSQTGGPYVRARVSSSGGRVWPDTTPNYRTRLHP